MKIFSAAAKPPPKKKHFRKSGMSDEEKERLKEMWKKRCEHGGFFGKNQY
ncbi:MAG TPA: hypothetical protein PKI04_02480 [Kaistella sp.]|nr:hypothetical protein [Kaistella sp.]